ncbi:MAG: NACHT domain-containing protein [Limisphaerales bacterium]
MNLDLHQNSDLWIDYEDINESVPAAPVETRSQVLPLNQLSWENFERLCYRLVLREASFADCRRYGIQGQEQQGIDIYVRRTSDGGYSTWQCKRYSDFSASDLEKAVSKFLENDWAKRSDVFHLAVTVSLSSTDLAKAVEKQAQICRTKGIEFVPQDIERLSDRLKKHPDLVDDFFGRSWVEAFCGRDVATTLSGRRLNKQQRIEARRRFRELYITHFAAVDVGLPAAAGALREVAPQLQLQKRYVVPLVDSITSIIEPLSTGDKPTQNSENESNNTSSEDSKLSKTQSERGGFRTIEQRTKLNLFDWFESVERGVILGGPGLGKSAALRFLALDLLSDQPRTEGLARRFGSYLPIFVPFALLTRLVANQEVININDFLNSWLHKLSAPPQTVQLLKEALEDERLLLLVDGLDEWSDPTAASTSLTMILDFAILRRLPVIASARPVVRNRETLRKWARTQIDASRAHGKLRPMGFDMLSGAVRPVELCILDACLTS